MKFFHPIPISKIPTHPPGTGTDRKRTSFYDSIADKVKALPQNKALPIECASARECTNVMQAMRIRGYKVVRRGLTVYVFCEGKEKNET